MLLVGPTDALAQAGSCSPVSGVTSCLPADNLWAHAHGPFTWIAPAAPPGDQDLAVGLTTSWVHKPIGITGSAVEPSGTTTYLVENAVTATLAASLGLTSRLAFDVAAPFTLYQSGAGLGLVTGTTEEFPRSAVGELRLGPSVTLLRRKNFALASRLHVLAPTGSPRGFSRFASVTFAPGLSTTYRVGRFGLGADLGARLREAVTLGDAVIGHQVSLGLGATYDIIGERWLTVGAEAFALFGLDSRLTVGSAQGGADAGGEPLIPAEWLVSFATGRLLDGKLRARVGMGGAIPTGGASDVTAPLLRTVASLSFTP
jgi:hypothetical protein